MVVCGVFQLCLGTMVRRIQKRRIDKTLKPINIQGGGYSAYCIKLVLANIHTEGTMLFVLNQY